MVRALHHQPLIIRYFQLIIDASVGRHTAVDTHKPGSDWARRDCV